MDIKQGDIIRINFYGSEFVTEILAVVEKGAEVKVESSPGTVAFMGIVYRDSPLWDYLTTGELIDGTEDEVTPDYLD